MMSPQGYNRIGVCIQKEVNMQWVREKDRIRDKIEWLHMKHPTDRKVPKQFRGIL